MRRNVMILLVSLAAAGQAAAAAHKDAPPPAPKAVSGPPHAWLYGTWTGGLFPVLDGMTAQDCRTQPTVAFGQDVVRHSSLTGTNLSERVIETVRAVPNGTIFRFTPLSSDPAGFGCPDPNGLTVQREAAGQISFPHCAAFPYPLERCPAH